MRIELHRSGGIAGNIRRPPLTVDTSTLPREQAAELEELARRAPEAAPPPVTAAPGGADRMTYELTIEDAGEQRTLTFSDAGSLPELRELAKRVRELGG